MTRLIPLLAMLALTACIPPTGPASGGGPTPGAPQPLPAPRAEVAPPRPTPAAVWQPGTHEWEGAAYAWQPGRWTDPRGPGAFWQDGHWAPGTAGYAWVPGRWI